MATITANYGLTKPDTLNYYDISIPNNNMDIVDEALKDNADIIAAESEARASAITTLENLISNMNARTAGGTATALTVTLENITVYRAGMKVTAIAISNNGGAATTLKINSLATKPIYKPNTTDAPNIKAGRPYTFILSADLSHFFIEASAEGTAVAADVLAGETFSNDDDSGLVGIMTNNGSVGTVNLTSDGAEYTIPAGYHNGLGKVKAAITGLAAGVIKVGMTVGGILGTFTADATATAAGMLSGLTAYVNGVKITGNIPSRGAQTYTPTTANQTIIAGQYLSGVQTIAGDADLVQSNIKKGIDIFGVVGNYAGPSPVSWNLKATKVDGSSTGVLRLTQTGTSYSSVTADIGDEIYHNAATTSWLALTINY